MIVVAAGGSTRFGAEKMTAVIRGLPLIAHTVRALAPAVDSCVVACRAEHLERFEGLRLPATFVVGGESRTASEMAGLAALGDTSELIGIHDGARPLVSPGLISSLFAAAALNGGAVPCLDPSYLLLTRDSLSALGGAMTVQTPQVFRSEVLLPAYVRAAQAGFEGHDTVDVVLRFGDTPVAAVPGEPDNIKVTYPADLAQVEARLADPGRSGPE